MGPRSVHGQQASAISAGCSVLGVCARPWSPAHVAQTSIYTTRLPSLLQGPQH